VHELGKGERHAAAEGGEPCSPLAGKRSVSALSGSEKQEADEGKGIRESSSRQNEDRLPISTRIVERRKEPG